MRAQLIAQSLVAAIAILPAAQAWGAPKPEDSPLLTPIDKAHCFAMYDVVELRLKGKGPETVSTVTSNSLKDFFVTRPGVVDCSGQREIAWTDDKDRALIADLLKETGEAAKAKLDMSKAYGIGPAPKATQPRR